MKELYTIESEESITEAVAYSKHNIKRLGVVYKNRLVGIISSSDVIAVTPDLVEIVSEKATIIRGELGIARSASNISGFCDQCGEWSDLLQYVEDTFICEVCRGESSSAEGVIVYLSLPMRCWETSPASSAFLALIQYILHTLVTTKS